MKEFSVLQVLREFSHPESANEVGSTDDSGEDDDEDISVDEFDGDGSGMV